MAPNLPPKITVNKNLASTLRDFIKENSGKNVNETQLNEILQRIAIFDAERDNGTRPGNSIFEGGSKYFGGDGSNFQVKEGQQIQLSVEEYNAIFEGYIDPIKAQIVNTENPMPTPEIQTQSPTATEEAMKPSQIVNTENPISTPEIQTQSPTATEEAMKPSQIVNTENPIPTLEIPQPETNKDNKIQKIFPNGLPEGVTASYVKIDGFPVLIFKKDGQTLDQKSLKALAAKAASSPAKPSEGNSPDILPSGANQDGALADNTPVEDNDSPATQKHANGNSPSNISTADTPDTALPPPQEAEIQHSDYEDTNEEQQTKKNFGIGNISTPFEQQTLDMLYKNTSVHTNFLKNANELLGTVEYKNQNELTADEKRKTQAGIIGRYGTADHQWCAHAVSTLAEQSGINIGGHKAQVQQFINWGKSQGLYNPIKNTTITATNFESVRESRAQDISEQIGNMQEGDLIIWKSRYAAKTNEGIHLWNASHIGIIESADLENGTVTVLEGNANIPRSDDTYERYIVRNSSQGLMGDQVVGEPEELNRTDGFIRKVYTIQDLANFGYSGYINMQELV